MTIESGHAGLARGVTGERAAVVIEMEHARDTAETHVAGGGDRELELFGGLEQRFEALHEIVVDRFVIAHEEVGELERGSFAVGEQRTRRVVVDRRIDRVGNRLLRRRRRTPLESNGAAVEPGDQKADELTLA